MQALIENSERFATLHSDLEADKETINEMDTHDEITEEVAQSVQRLWKSEAIQITFSNASKFHLFDGAEYLLDRVMEVTTPDYVVKDEDLYRTRVRTTGVVDQELEINNVKFTFYDVGGQRNERRKWIHCFEDVTAVLFLAAISAYDQVLFEDGSTNRMHEALGLFEQICSSQYFQKSNIILFLNKFDIFQKKIQKVSLKQCFPDYEGKDGDQDDATTYIKEAFKAKQTKSQQFYMHLITATDTSNIQKVFDTVKEIFLKKELDMAGLG